MQCVTPMFRRYKMGKHSQGQVVPRSEVLDCLDYDPNHIRRCLDDVNSYARKHGHGFLYEQIPCQHCWACKLNYAAQWATRIMMECSYHRFNYFVTFTYNEENLPIATETEYNGQTYYNDGTWTGTLCPEDITRFINSLRKRLERHGGNRIKYFVAGEYGPNGDHRPHYHMILMNCNLNMKEFYDFHEKNSKMLWKSRELDSLWKKGFIEIGEVEFASAAYVARYCMKKITDLPDKTIYWMNGRHPEYVRMSRRPGIGFDYYEDHKEEIYKYDSIPFKNFHGESITVKPPSAWDKKFAKTHPQEYLKLKRNRKEMAERSRQLLQEMSDISDKQRLEENAERIITKGKMLPRDAI